MSVCLFVLLCPSTFVNPSVCPTSADKNFELNDLTGDTTVNHAPTDGEIDLSERERERDRPEREREIDLREREIDLRMREGERERIERENRERVE